VVPTLSPPGGPPQRTALKKAHTGTENKFYYVISLLYSHHLKGVLQ